MSDAEADYRLPALTRGRILKRYKRFLADVELANGEVVIAHCPNTGAMTGCWEPGAPVEISHSDNPKRKLAWTLERVDMGSGWVGVNTARTNQIIETFLNKGLIPGLETFESLQREPRVNPGSADRSRFDFLLTGADGSRCYIEVKNTSLIHEDRICFPDAVTARGRKHLELLAERATIGDRAVILYAPEPAGRSGIWPGRPRRSGVRRQSGGSGITWRGSVRSAVATHRLGDQLRRADGLRDELIERTVAGQPHWLFRR